MKMPRRDARARRSDAGPGASKYRMCLTRDEKSRRGDDSCGRGKPESRAKPSVVTDGGMTRGEPRVWPEVARESGEKAETTSTRPVRSL